MSRPNIPCLSCVTFLELETGAPKPPVTSCPTSGPMSNGSAEALPERAEG